LAVAQKPDSHDICFVPSGDNAGWLRDRLGSEVGPIVDQDGTKIGEHKGAYTYTIGQRKGLGITVPTADGSPRFVLKIEPVTNTVVVGAREELAISTMKGERGVDHVLMANTNADLFKYVRTVLRCHVLTTLTEPC
jgi:tRNA-specific 2-thiouridylase